MADIKITDLAAYTDPVSTDVLPIVDLGSDLTKKVRIADLLENAGTGTAAAPSFSFDGDNDTGIYLPGADQVAISTNGTGRLFVAADGSVGLGTDSPQATLHVKSDSIGIPAVGVAGTMQVGDGNAFGLMLGVNDSGVGYIQPQRNDGATTTYGLLLNPNGGNVSIGSSSASEKLEVYGNARFKATDGSHGIELYPDVGGLGYQRILSFNRTSSAYEDLSFGVSNFIVTSGATSESLRITSGGLVGIGTSAPTQSLTIANTSTAQIHLHSAFPAIRLSSDAGGSDDAKRAFFGLSTASNGFITGSALNDLCIAGTSGGKVLFGVGNSPKMAITSGGSVGIGTTSPSRTLQVHESASATGAYLKISNAGTGATATDGTDLLVNPDGTFFIINRENASIIFNNNGSEKARIDSSGRLLVGTSSDSGGALLQVNDNRVRIATAKTPASASDTGTTGEICWDANYIYVCTATNTWKRTAIATW